MGTCLTAGPHDMHLHIAFAKPIMNPADSKTYSPSASA